MNDSARSMSVLQKILNEGRIEQTKPTSHAPEELIHNYWKPQAPSKKIRREAGRPKLEEHLKSRNFTLCLAPKYLSFLDKMTVPDPKVKGRGRKVRFIVDQFIEMSRRQKSQLLILRESLINVEKVLQSFSGQVKKGQKLSLNSKDKLEITKAVNQVRLLLKLLSYSPKDLHRLLPRHEWTLVSFCLNWTQNQEQK
jgi:hypothetical protein